MREKYFIFQKTILIDNIIMYVGTCSEIGWLVEVAQGNGVLLYHIFIFSCFQFEHRHNLYVVI